MVEVLSMATADENKELVRRMIEEGFNQNDLDVVDEIVAEDCVLHEAGQPEPLRGPDEVKEFLRMYRNAFSDAHIEIDELLADGDMVVTRWTATGTHDGDLMGIEPTGADVTVMGMEMHRVEDGKLVEGWELFDALGMLQQLGAIPSDLSSATPTADD